MTVWSNAFFCSFSPRETRAYSIWASLGLDLPLCLFVCSTQKHQKLLKTVSTIWMWNQEEKLPGDRDNPQLLSNCRVPPKNNAGIIMRGIRPDGQCQARKGSSASAIRFSFFGCWGVCIILQIRWYHCWGITSILRTELTNSCNKKGAQAHVGKTSTARAAFKATTLHQNDECWDWSYNYVTSLNHYKVGAKSECRTSPTLRAVAAVGLHDTPVRRKQKTVSSASAAEYRKR